MLKFDPVSLQTVFSTGVLHEGWTNWVYDSFDHERETSFPNSGALAGKLDDARPVISATEKKAREI
jgi:hypothetical protein